ncbi:MAG: type II 3-dehydroquinate dehydratase [Chloroflexi bacterium HGW-Chloroflexi-3]|nr:MAG: type II 3-dehydroquinate dehydratase [Chloroflexi bacterium HGW-Chloroflexi-3]
MKNNILVLHGANLNMLGKREPHIYGHKTLAQIDQAIQDSGSQLGLTVDCQQFNSEGELVTALQEAEDWANGVLFNPGGYTHTSVVLRDTVAAISIPVIEIHLSNTQAREDFRRHSLIGPVCKGSIAGFGWYSYILGLHAIKDMLC